MILRMMKLVLIGFIVASVGLHVAEHLLKKGKRAVAIITIAFHIFAIFAFLLFQLTLQDMLLFLLCSSITALFLKLQEGKNGI